MGLVIVLMGLYIVKINTGSNMEAVEKEVQVEEEKEIYKGIELKENEKVSLLHGNYESIDPRDDIIITDPELDENGHVLQAPRYANEVVHQGSYLDPNNEMYEMYQEAGKFSRNDIDVYMDTEHFIVRELGRSGHTNAYIDVMDAVHISKIDKTMYRVSGTAYTGDGEPLGLFDIELKYYLSAVNSWIDYKWKIIEQEN